MQPITPQAAGFVLAFAGTIALLFCEPIARWDARIPLLARMVDERVSVRMVEASSAGCLAIGALLLLASV